MHDATDNYVCGNFKDHGLRIYLRVSMGSVIRDKKKKKRVPGQTDFKQS